MLAEWRDARIRLIYLSGYEKGARDAGEQQTVLLEDGQEVNKEKKNKKKGSMIRLYGTFVRSTNPSAPL